MIAATGAARTRQKAAYAEWKSVRVSTTLELSMTLEVMMLTLFGYAHDSNSGRYTPFKSIATMSFGAAIYEVPFSTVPKIIQN